MSRQTEVKKLLKVTEYHEVATENGTAITVLKDGGFGFDFFFSPADLSGGDKYIAQQIAAHFDE